jgi:transcriptional regulator
MKGTAVEKKKRRPRLVERQVPIFRTQFTQQEIADACGITRAAINVIEQRALKKIRMEFKSRGWGFDDTLER